MAMKYRADTYRDDKDGSRAWFAQWMGGPSLSKIENCRIDLAGDNRVTAMVTGEADTYFSIPAQCSFRGCRVRGYITTDDDGWIFRVCFY